MSEFLCIVVFHFVVGTLPRQNQSRRVAFALGAVSRYSPHKTRMGWNHTCAADHTAGWRSCISLRLLSPVSIFVEAEPETFT